MPPDLTVAQIRWSMIGDGSTRLIGRSEVISASGKVSSSYSCNTCCPNSPDTGAVTPNALSLYLTDSGQLQATQQDRDCYGNIYQPYPVGWRREGVQWRSEDETVAAVNFNGLVTAMDVGDTLIDASWEATRWQENLTGSGCDAFEELLEAVGEMEVRPKITGISPPCGGVGNAIKFEN